jgi:hypothetical protein
LKRSVKDCSERKRCKSLKNKKELLKCFSLDFENEMKTKEKEEIKEMKKLVLVAVVFVFLFAAVGTAFAKGKSGAAGKSNVSHLYLYEKDASYVIVPNGAWGKMKYNLSGPTFNFVFNGHALELSTSYALIYYNGWTDIVCLGNAMSDEYGNVHIAGSVTIGSLIESEGLPGAKIWLVLSNDCAATTMTNWNPTEYLFENNRIYYTYVP